jgi:hypothetical protein
MMALSEDARRLLGAFTEADGPTDWNDVVSQLASKAGPWTRDYNGWIRRRDHLIAETMLLFRDGLLEELPDGAVDMTVITEAGREALGRWR